MKVRIRPANEEAFAERAAWRYEPPYDAYNDDGKPVKNPERFYGAYGEDDAVVGLYYFEQRDDATFFGVALRPDLTGTGLGPEFVQTGLDFARSNLGAQRFILDVAEFNVRARRVYERVGFRKIGEHITTFGGRDVTFIDMELPA